MGRGLAGTALGTAGVELCPNILNAVLEVEGGVEGTTGLGASFFGVTVGTSRGLASSEAGVRNRLNRPEDGGGAGVLLVGGTTGAILTGTGLARGFAVVAPTLGATRAGPGFSSSGLLDSVPELKKLKNAGELALGAGATGGAGGAGALFATGLTLTGAEAPLTFSSAIWLTSGSLCRKLRIPPKRGEGELSLVETGEGAVVAGGTISRTFAAGAGSGAFGAEGGGLDFDGKNFPNRDCCTATVSSLFVGFAVATASVWVSLASISFCSISKPQMVLSIDGHLQHY